MLDTGNKALHYLAALVTVSLYIFIGYFLVREQNVALFTAYTTLFVCFIYFVTIAQKVNDISKLIALGILCRLIFVVVLPNLSDDFYRFIWDGRLSLQEINPFSHIPSWYIENAHEIPGIEEALFTKLNSPEYFTVYPPVNQFIFLVSSWISPNSILGNAIALRCFILAADIGSIFMVLRLLKKYNLPQHRVLLYALNPLIILEFSSSLHFEAIMVFFVLLSVLLLTSKKWLGSAAAMALAICTKLIPLIFLPLFFKKLGFKKALLYYAVITIFTVILFSPLVSLELIEGMKNSVSLYFQTFEFNASIYYVVREIGFYFTGYNIIAQSGKVLALVTFISILAYTFFSRKSKRSMPAHFLWVYFVYILLATTVHPWYITPLIAFGLFTKYKFQVVWAFTVFLSYLSYQFSGFHENLYFVSLEYGLVFAWLIYELRKSKKVGFVKVEQYEKI